MRTACPPTTELISFTTGEGDRDDRLVGTLAYPGDREPTASPVLLLPPHPNFAGDRSNRVIQAVAAGLATRGRVVLSFDYHGIGGSTARQVEPAGLLDHWAEIESRRDHRLPIRDARAALRALHAVAPNSSGQVAICAYSYGTVVADLGFGAEQGLAASVWLGAPFRRHAFRSSTTATPLLVLSGSEDFLLDRDEMRQLARARGVRTRCLAGADHFFRGREGEVALQVCTFFDEVNP